MLQVTDEDVEPVFQLPIWENHIEGVWIDLRGEGKASYGTVRHRTVYLGKDGDPESSFVMQIQLDLDHVDDRLRIFRIERLVRRDSGTQIRARIRSVYGPYTGPYIPEARCRS